MLRTEARLIPDGAAFLESQQTAALLFISTRTLWRLVAAGKFPAPIRLSRKLVRWNRATVEDWIEANK